MYGSVGKVYADVGIGGWANVYVDADVVVDVDKGKNRWRLVGRFLFFFCLC